MLAKAAPRRLSRLPMNNRSMSRGGRSPALIDGTAPNRNRCASIPAARIARTPCSLMSRVARPRRAASTDRRNHGVPGCSVHTHTLAAAARCRSVFAASDSVKNSCGATTRLMLPSTSGRRSVTSIDWRPCWAAASTSARAMSRMNSLPRSDTNTLTQATGALVARASPVGACFIVVGASRRYRGAPCWWPV